MAPGVSDPGWGGPPLGALLENRVDNALSTTVGANAQSLGAAVSSAALRAVAGRPDLVEPAKAAFTIGLDDVLLAGSLVLVVGTLAAVILLRSPAPARTPVPENA